MGLSCFLFRHHRAADRKKLTVNRSPFLEPTMPAINSLVARDTMTQLAKRNWAAQEPGVMVVFCIVGIVGISIIGFVLYRLISRKRAEREVKRVESHV